MRVTSLFAVAAVLTCAPAAAQSPTPVAEVYNLDPYDPSDAELLRKYGSVLVAQTPLLELRKLDPHTPRHAALLRDLGGAIPLWGLWYPPAPLPASLSPFAPATTAAPAPTVVVVMAPPPAAAGAASAGPPAAPAQAPTTTPESPRGAMTLLAPDSNDGVWISYSGQRWLSAGPAVPLDRSALTQVGQHGSFPIFKRQGIDDVIYVATSDDLAAPFRVK